MLNPRLHDIDRREVRPMSKANPSVLGPEVGTARLVGNYVNGSPEWHALRATGIGGSDIAAIVKCSPWTSPFTLWAKKTGRIDDTISPSEAADWGNRLEPVVLDAFEEAYPELTVHRNVGTYQHVDREWQLANPDAIYETATGELGIIEVKTSRYEDDWAQGVPAYYKTQVLWYAQTFGFTSTIYVVALFAGSKFKVYEVKPDEFEQSVNLAEACKFRDLVVADTQPDYDGALNTYETIRVLHPDIEADSEVELGDLGMYYTLALDEFAQAEAKLNEMKSRVLDAMGKAKRGLINDVWAVTRQARGTGAPYLVNKKG